jgi:RimJ/RimL family protein N-acetyltransferase
VTVSLADADPAPESLPIQSSLRLRRFDPDGADEALLAELLRWYRDPDTVRDLEGPTAEPYNEERLLRMLRHLRDHGELYLIEQRNDETWQPIGDVTLQPHAIPIMLRRESRRQGIARAVIQTLITRARSLGWTVVNVSDIYATNTASRHLFESLGFRQTKKTDLGHSYTLPL